ncbi:hypothetical protein [Streptomyces sp. R35]|uniref:Uncharacterized protein n=1 Tax=Streptomyces sp. R35 TaxID=3238630 RepID=A0AB39STE8_9ACTN
MSETRVNAAGVTDVRTAHQDLHSEQGALHGEHPGRSELTVGPRRLYGSTAGWGCRRNTRRSDSGEGAIAVRLVHEHRTQQGNLVRTSAKNAPVPHLPRREGA